MSNKAVERGKVMSIHQLVKAYEAKQMNAERPQFRSGDTVVVSSWVIEGERKRLQDFEGVVIAIRNRGLNSSFIARKHAYGTDIERTFQTHSKQIKEIKIKRRGKVRRAKLFYLRSLQGKQARIKEKVS